MTSNMWGLLRTTTLSCSTIARRYSSAAKRLAFGFGFGSHRSYCANTRPTINFDARWNTRTLSAMTDSRPTLLTAPVAQDVLIERLTEDTTTTDSTSRTTKLSATPSSRRRARLIPRSDHFVYVSPLVIEFPYAIQVKGETQEEREQCVEGWLAEREPATHSKSTPHSEPHLLYPSLVSPDVHRVLLASSPSALPCVRLTGEQGEIDYLGGGAVRNDFKPYAMRYEGWQFGVNAGQLGDGRAIIVGIFENENGKRYELQLKGTGRTPFSRHADGLAVLRSSVREFLCSEYMSALGIPTTRALSLVAVDGVRVMREKGWETACLVGRVADEGGFLRLGSMHGGGQVMGQVVAGLMGIQGDWKRELILEVARRNARTVGMWQAWGFMHGVLNTDNISLMGLTIDYGPFAFMDIFDPLHICNDSDDGGRYSYRNQPEMVRWGCERLVADLFPDPSSSFYSSTPSEQGQAILAELKTLFDKTYEDSYYGLMMDRLGIKEGREVVDELLIIMRERGLDYSTTFWGLSVASLSQHTESFVEEVSWLQDERPWLSKYLALDPDQEKMRKVNPRFLLRQWVLEAVIADTESSLSVANTDAEKGHLISRVLALALDPFNVPAEDEWLCGVGEGEMVGFRCSCSS